jgi:hypothetical protein
LELDYIPKIEREENGYERSGVIIQGRSENSPGVFLTRCNFFPALYL